MKIFGKNPLPSVTPDEDPEKIRTRELHERLIQEHSSANQRGRELIAARAHRNTMRYYDALESAARIMGGK